MKKGNLQEGFTLIEVMIYLGLFTILMSGVIVSAFNILESEKKNETKSFLNNEAEYLVAKINWALTGAQVINTPLSGSTGSLLSVNRVVSTSNGVPTMTAVTIGLSGTDMTMALGSNPSEVLNNSNTEVTRLVFTRSVSTNAGNPENIVGVIQTRMRTPNGMFITRDATTTVYIRE